MTNRPPIPAKRLTESVPFSLVGFDYFGPLYVKINTESIKVWVGLYTCLVVRAVHLELLLDMPTEQCLLDFGSTFQLRKTKTDQMRQCFTVQMSKIGVGPIVEECYQNQ